MTKPTTVAEYVASLPEAQQPVAQRLAALLDAGLPGVPGVLWQGHPVWKDGPEPVAGFKAFPRWVSLLVWDGAAAGDTTGTLALSPRGMGTVKLSSLDDLDEPAVTAWLAGVAASRA